MTDALKRIDAYVRLLDEGIDVWRPCKIHIVDSERCIVLANHYDFLDQDEVWEVRPGCFAEFKEKNGEYYVSPEQD